MTITYMQSESIERPLLIEITTSTVYLRKDIIEEERIMVENDEPTTFYVYQEAKLTPEEFNIYATQIASINAIKGINDSENISKIVQNGVYNEDNQLVLMEAMADLYDLIAMMLG